MQTQPATLDELHAFVHHSLCAAENLLTDQFTTQERPLLANGNLCGIEFTLRGLRNVRLSAIWAADQNAIYFYDARGDRSRKVQLTTRPDVSALAMKSQDAQAA